MIYIVGFLFVMRLFVHLFVMLPFVKLFVMTPFRYLVVWVFVIMLVNLFMITRLFEMTLFMHFGVNLVWHPFVMQPFVNLFGRSLASRGSRWCRRNLSHGMVSMTPYGCVLVTGLCELSHW